MARRSRLSRFLHRKKHKSSSEFSGYAALAANPEAIYRG
jgi:hypothetical protein